MKAYAHAGLAGCVSQRRSRLNGKLVGVYHGEQSGLDADPTLPWLSVCEEHGTLVGNETLALARGCIDTREWCDDCRKEQGQ